MRQSESQPGSTRRGAVILTEAGEVLFSTPYAREVVERVGLPALLADVGESPTAANIAGAQLDLERRRLPPLASGVRLELLLLGESIEADSTRQRVHEVRGALNGVTISADLISHLVSIDPDADASREPRLHKVAETIGRQVRDLTRLIEAMPGFSRAGTSERNG